MHMIKPAFKDPSKEFYYNYNIFIIIANEMEINWKKFFFLFLNFDINYDIHDINYKIWYFCYHAERLINFIF